MLREFFFFVSGLPSIFRDYRRDTDVIKFPFYFYEKINFSIKGIFFFALLLLVRQWRNFLMDFGRTGIGEGTWKFELNFSTSWLAFLGIFGALTFPLKNHLSPSSTTQQNHWKIHRPKRNNKNRKFLITKKPEIEKDLPKFKLI